MDLSFPCGTRIYRHLFQKGKYKIRIEGYRLRKELPPIKGKSRYSKKNAARTPLSPPYRLGLSHPSWAKLQRNWRQVGVSTTLGSDSALDRKKKGSKALPLRARLDNIESETGVSVDLGINGRAEVCRPQVGFAISSTSLCQGCLTLRGHGGTRWAGLVPRPRAGRMEADKGNRSLPQMRMPPQETVRFPADTKPASMDGDVLTSYQLSPWRKLMRRLGEASRATERRGHRSPPAQTPNRGDSGN